MATFHGHFSSVSLGGMQTSLQVILPEHHLSTPNRTLYLLHGLNDNETIWTRRTAVERYADTYGFSIIMPFVDTSYYTDMAYGKNYWTYLSEELPKAVSSYFGLNPDPASTYVAGHSMGGYGSFKLALNHPEHFAAAASFSGALDVSSLLEYTPEDKKDQRRRSLNIIFGENSDLDSFGGDLFTLVNQHQKAKRPLPNLYQFCGTEDYLYNMNTKFRDHLTTHNIPAYYEESKADHTWDYWDYCIETFMRKISEAEKGLD
ncbi:alpha/beta hydrolase [Alkalicoccobacillus murimartini]|uniref:S-formylglutathione hydrolase FrmB n=1 Tax=Alkalicoccobacillus murimartini TaxID=171685 RepID=A0ABT9YH36_9BACI|nr:alpha/beta hydrolase family protein [Alkalicoccobacillus murimartini]MDQ0207009.1 S-formylglutathione hydrolase FrmB [Alkalicoccobacillus murimartini]